MGMEFKLTREVPQGKPNVAILHLGGWLDIQSEKILVEAMQKARNEGAEYVLLELSGLDTITSAGIRAIQKSFAIMTPKGEDSVIGRLKLCSAPPQIYQVLKLTGMLISIPVYESQDIAIESFGK
jgi:stage II sporulation protein AA (anti-sigma F factor antagonist)